MNQNIHLINTWLELIPIKKIINLELTEDLTNKYNTFSNNIIISFDVEFIKYNLRHKEIIKQTQTIHEMGGIILIKNNNKWYLHSLFHLNLLPLISDIDKYYLLKSQYNSLSEKTLKIIEPLEEELLPNKLENSNIENLQNNNILKIYLPKKKINSLKKNKDNSYLFKKISKIKFMIKGEDLKEYPKEYKLFNNIIKLILDDTSVISRRIKRDNQKKFINLTNKLFTNSLLIVKGLEDLKALKNHSILLDENYNDFKYVFDIAKYNNELFKLCNSAELEKDFLCLQNLGKTNIYEKYEKIIKDFTNFKAHNPLVDAYYTWIIFNIYNI
jgi:hypothetical protein